MGPEHVFEWDDRSSREKDVEYRLQIADEQGFVRVSRSIVDSGPR